MVSGGGGKSKSSSRQESRATFPGAFLQDFEGAFGRGVSLEELLAGLPRSSGLFGGGPVGIMPTGNQAGTRALPYAPVGREYQQPDQAFPGAGGGGGGGAGGRPGTGGGGGGGGAAPGSPGAPPNYQGGMVDPNAPFGPRFAASGSNLGGLDVQGSLQRLGFNDAPPDFSNDPRLNIRDLPTINAPTAQAAQMNIQGGDFGRFEDSLFRSQFDPVAREINRQGATDDRQLQAQLAQSGLASSGSGVGQIQAQTRERAQTIQNAATDAAQRAAAQRYGYQFSQEENNANLRQQTNLANAGFDMTAQQANADNILRGDTARSDTYLKTMGLNQQAAQAMRGDFLKVMDLAEADLQRMDNFQLQTLGVLLNNWLQQAGLAGQAGRESEGVSKSSSVQANVGIGAG